MERIGPVGDAALGRILARAPLTPEKVRFAWRLAVGPAIARACTVELRDARLVVRVSEAAWAREIARARGIIFARVQRLLGPDVVRALELPAHDDGRTRDSRGGTPRARLLASGARPRPPRSRKKTAP